MEYVRNNNAIARNTRDETDEDRRNRLFHSVEPQDGDMEYRQGVRAYWDATELFWVDELNPASRRLRQVLRQRYGNNLRGLFDELRDGDIEYDDMGFRTYWDAVEMGWVGVPEDATNRFKVILQQRYGNDLKALFDEEDDYEDEEEEDGDGDVNM